jgi:hypothetical protein
VGPQVSGRNPPGHLTLPRHARSVALVLSLSTGHVSPQFHMKFDDFFETAQDTKTRPESRWQRLSRFVSDTSKVPAKQGVTGKPSRAPPQGGPQESLTFDLVDQGEPEDAGDEMLDPDDTDPAPSLHGEESIPAKPPDPERHRHQESTRRSSCQSVPARRLIARLHAQSWKTQTRSKITRSRIRLKTQWHSLPASPTPT